MRSGLSLTCIGSYSGEPLEIYLLNMFNITKLIRGIKTHAMLNAINEHQRLF